MGYPTAVMFDNVIKISPGIITLALLTFNGTSKLLNFQLLHYLCVTYIQTFSLLLDRT